MVLRHLPQCHNIDTRIFTRIGVKKSFLTCSLRLNTAKLGPINDIMVLLERECPEEAKQFLIDNYITKEGYHGGELEGGNVTK